MFLEMERLMRLLRLLDDVLRLSPRESPPSDDNGKAGTPPPRDNALEDTLRCNRLLLALFSAPLVKVCKHERDALQEA